MLKKLLKIIESTKIVDNYVAEGKERGVEHDRRIRELTRATLDGEHTWFLRIIKDDPECLLKILKECNNNDSID